MQRVKFLYNPYSGENKILDSLDFIINSYQSKGFQIEPFRFTNETSLNDALKDIDSSYHHILAAGGDGTINEIVNGIVNNSIKTPLAILPAGTANDFAHMLGFGTSIKKSCLEILSGKTVSVDLGVVNDKYFVNVLSAGFFTEISQKTPSKFKNTFGKLAYYMSSVGELPNFRKIHIHLDSQDLVYDDDCLVIFVFNGRTAGNVQIAHHSNLHDGLLDVLVVKSDNIVEALSTAFHFVTKISTDYPRGVVHFKTKKLSIRSEDDISVDIDGEAGPTLPIEVSCIEKGLNVIVGQKYLENKNKD